MFVLSKTEGINGLDKTVPSIEYKIIGRLYFESEEEQIKQLPFIERCLQNDINPTTKYKYICEKGFHILKSIDEN